MEQGVTPDCLIDMKGPRFLLGCLLAGGLASVAQAGGKTYRMFYLYANIVDLVPPRAIPVNFKY